MNGERHARKARETYENVKTVIQGITMSSRV